MSLQAESSPTSVSSTLSGLANASAVGRRIGQPGAWQEIVGVVADVRSATDAGQPTSRFQCYRPLAQDPSSGLARALASLAPGLKANQPLVLLSVSGLLLAVAFVSCWLPARRASRLDPMVALRSA